MQFWGELSKLSQSTFTDTPVPHYFSNLLPNIDLHVVQNKKVTILNSAFFYINIVMPRGVARTTGNI